MSNTKKVTFNDGLDKCPICYSPRLKRIDKKTIQCLKCKEVMKDHSPKQTEYSFSNPEPIEN